MVTKIDKHNIAVEHALDPDLYSEDTTSGAIDTQGFEAVTFVANVGAFGDEDTAAGANKIDFQVQHSDDTVGGNFVDVADADLSDSVAVDGETGVFARIDAADEDDMAYLAGYIGDKRYVRINVNFTGTHNTGTDFGVSVIKSTPNSTPAE